MGGDKGIFNNEGTMVTYFQIWANFEKKSYVFQGLEDVNLYRRPDISFDDFIKQTTHNLPATLAYFKIAWAGLGMSHLLYNRRFFSYSFDNE